MHSRESLSLDDELMLLSLLTITKHVTETDSELRQNKERCAVHILFHSTALPFFIKPGNLTTSESMSSSF